MLKLFGLLFGPFYSKIGLDPCIVVVKETKKNIHIHIPSSTTLAPLFTTIEGLCPVDFILNKNRIWACDKVYFNLLLHPTKKLGGTYVYIYY